MKKYLMNNIRIIITIKWLKYAFLLENQTYNLGSKRSHMREKDARDKINSFTFRNVTNIGKRN